MKKCLSILVLTASAFVGLASCSGGDGDAGSNIITIQQFRSGARTFVFSSLIQMRVTPTGVISSADYDDTTASAYVDFVCGGLSFTGCEAVYTLTTFDQSGTPVEATLEITLTDTNANDLVQDDDFRANFSIPVSTDSDTDTGALAFKMKPITFDINFPASKAYVAFEYKWGDIATYQTADSEFNYRADY